MKSYLVNNLKIRCELILTSIQNKDNKESTIIQALIDKIPDLDDNQLLDFKNLFLDSELQPLIAVLINTTNASAQELGFELRDHIAAINSQKKENNSNEKSFYNFPIYTTRFPVGRPLESNLQHSVNNNLKYQ